MSTAESPRLFQSAAYRLASMLIFVRTDLWKMRRLSLFGPRLYR